MKSRSTPIRTVVSRMLAAGALGIVATVVATAQPPNPSNPLKLTKGIVTDTRTGKPVDGGKIFVYLGSASEPVAQSRINPSTGAFQVVLSPSQEYRFVLRSNRYLPSESTVRTPGGSNYEEVVRNLTMDPIPVGQTIYSGRLFETGSATLSSSAELAKALAFLKQSQAATVKITVLADAKGAASAKAPAKASAKPKKGKKGAAAAADAAPASSPTGTAQDPHAALAQSRTQTLRALMQKEGISLTRITWEPVTAGVSGRKDNVVITISGVDVEEVEEDS